MQENETPVSPQFDPAERQRTFLFRTVNLALLIAGVLSLLMAVLNVIAALSPSLASPTSWLDFASNLVMGGLLIFCSRLVKRGKFVALWVFIGTLALNVTILLATSRSLNDGILLVGALVIWQMLILKKNKQLA